MQIRFADSRPAGDYALVLPVAGKDRSTLDSLGAAQQALSRRARPPAVRRRSVERRRSSSSTTRAASRRLLVVGTGSGHRRRATRRRSSAARPSARLLTSGEKTRGHRPHAASATTPMRRRASGLGAALRAWRYDRYRTKLKDKQKPTLERSRRSSAAAPAPRKRYEQRWAPVVRRRLADPRAGHRAGQHHLSRELRRARRAPRSKGTRRRDRGARPRGDGEARHGRAARRRPGLGPRSRGC